ncbi:S1 family peptidase [Streptomyces sp. KR80]|uniref:S1 family peptidase n=1 Tax=Streptomyces sp. KR80 TaxID=3457426 RepID=UPI003FD320DD
MEHRRVTKRRATVAGAAIVALMGAGITLQSANASDDVPEFTPDTLSALAAGKLASDLSADLGSDAAGAYYDADSRTLVVNVLDKAALEAVQEAGGEARIVQNSLTELNNTRETLADEATTPGTAWAVDPTTNKVVVTADRTVDGAELTKLKEVVKDLGSTVEFKRSNGEFKPFVAGGDAILANGGRCSLGFNVIKNGAPAFITAGHCGSAGSTWRHTRGKVLGTMTNSQFPGNDFALVQYRTRKAVAPSAVNLYNGTTRRITRAAAATVGMRVTRSGSTTQVHKGRVTGLNATVNYGNGDVVTGLIQTNVCAEPGDSGGSLFSGNAAIGLTSGGSGNCTSGGTTFFQPVTEALKVYGAKIG